MDIFFDPKAMIDSEALTISVAGKPNLGKTGVTMAIAKMFAEYGIPVNSVNCDTAAAVYDRLAIEGHDKRVMEELIKKCVKINIVEQYVGPHQNNVPVQPSMRPRLNAVRNPVFIGDVLDRTAKLAEDTQLMQRHLVSLKKVIAEGADDQALLALLRQVGGGFAATMTAVIGQFDQELHLVHGYSGEENPAKKPTLN